MGLNVGLLVVGALDGFLLGDVDGDFVGLLVVGPVLGLLVVGPVEGRLVVGEVVGLNVGDTVGTAGIGLVEGLVVGSVVGYEVGGGWICNFVVSITILSMLIVNTHQTRNFSNILFVFY